MNAAADAGALIEWRAPIYYPSGFADEARELVSHLAAQGLDMAVQPQFTEIAAVRDQLSASRRELLDRLIARPADPQAIRILLMEPGHLLRQPQAAYHVGRVMFETDALPPGWAERCNLMDELWVPSRFNQETFERAGVSCPILQIPEGIDTERFRPDLQPLELPGIRGKVFLAVFTWLLRKGWDVLLKAWSWAFEPDDDVTLVIRTGFPGDPEGQIGGPLVNAALDRFLARELKTTRERLAPIVVLTGAVPEPDYPRLFASACALVAPSRGEGWGRPQMAAMASGLPVLATRWSGSLEFMNDDNSVLIEVDDLVEILPERSDLPHFAGQRWAEPSAAHLASAMHQIASDSAWARQIGERARADMLASWRWDRVSQVAGDRLRHLAATLGRDLAVPPRYLGQGGM